jgi:hypothetical protein
MVVEESGGGSGVMEEGDDEGGNLSRLYGVGAKIYISLWWVGSVTLVDEVVPLAVMPKMGW